MSDVLSIVTRYLGDRVPSYGTSSDELAIRCPFHKGGMEKRPSFNINLKSGLSFCHACGRGWNILSLLIELGVDRDTALMEAESLWTTEVKRPAGIVLPEWVIAGWKRFCPKVLLEQGFKMEVLREYEVGWDAERSMVVFPVRDHLGRLVAIQGRKTVDDGQGKYKTYRSELEEILDVPIEKVPLKNYVWNLHRWYAQGFYGKIEELLVVEGVKKALWCIQNGFPNTVSIFSSYLSDEQARLLSRLAVGRFICVLDGDTAGRKGVERFREKLGRLVRVPSWPDGVTQPDALSSDELAKLVESARSERCRIFNVGSRMHSGVPSSL